MSDFFIAFLPVLFLVVFWKTKKVGLLVKRLCFALTVVWVLMYLTRDKEAAERVGSQATGTDDLNKGMPTEPEFRKLVLDSLKEGFGVAKATGMKPLFPEDFVLQKVGPIFRHEYFGWTAMVTWKGSVPISKDGTHVSGKKAITETDYFGIRDGAVTMVSLSEYAEATQ